MEKLALLERITLLCASLQRYSNEYYIDDNPSISDADFDRMLHELIALEADHPDLKMLDSPTDKIGSSLPLEYQGARDHVFPMLSLSNCFSSGDLYPFFGLHESTTYSLEPKLDGLAISIIYIDGTFVRASTRGDGIKGEVVTDAVRSIKNVPLSLFQLDLDDIPHFIEVRGEVLMPKHIFKAYNAKAKKMGTRQFSSARNAASGTLRALDSEHIYNMNLSFMLYDIKVPPSTVHPVPRSHGVDSLPRSHAANLKLFSDAGFAVPQCSKVCNSDQEALEYIESFADTKDDLPYEVDGVVIKYDDLSIRDEIGVARKYPLWATAYKFPEDVYVTTLTDVIYQVGKRGIITPVGIFDVVVINGVSVERASLYNFDEIGRLSLMIGSTVRVKRAAEVIPKIIGTEDDLSETTPIVKPTHCPCCYSLLNYSFERVSVLCLNSAGCQDQIVGLVDYYCSNAAHNIKGLSIKTIELMVSSGLVSKPSCLYALTLEELIALPRIGNKKAANILKAIDASKNTTMYKFLKGMSIPEVGTDTIEILIDRFGDFQTIRDQVDFSSIKDIGPVINSSLLGFFSDEYEQTEVDNLLGLLVFPVDDIPAEPDVSSHLYNKKVAITGTFSVSRSVLAVRIKELGGKFSSSITASTDIVFLGANPGFNKLSLLEKHDFETLEGDDVLVSLGLSL